ncbi:MAG TPA: phenylalanine-4-hydroxylase [Bacteroidia bacterium]|nr:phenylalanine-4-hydroxylase [Bacteroidia bacterium]
MQQHWNKYTNEDHAVWKILFERQVKNLADKAWSRYLTCIPLSGQHADAVPDFSIVEKHLARTTGWTIEVVKGIIPVGEFLSLLSRKKFCSSTWLRQRHQLDYLEEPDMFHDTFGHIPLLADEDYSAFVKNFADMGLKFCHNEKAVMLLERLYWFTIEFGLMKENDALKIYGAGILSSFGESNHVFSANVVLKDFSVRDVLLQPFHNNEVQNIYFVVNGMNELWNCIPETEKFLEDFVDGKFPEEDFQFEKQLGSAMAEMMSDE